MVAYTVETPTVYFDNEIIYIIFDLAPWGNQMDYMMELVVSAQEHGGILKQKLLLRMISLKRYFYGILSRTGIIY